MKNNLLSKTIAVIIPCYNEESSVKRVILDFHAELPEATLVLVNNNSTDNTEKYSLEAFDEITSLPADKKILLKEWRQGKAFAVKKAFAEINADYYVLVDGDMTGDSAEQVHSLMEPVLSGKYDVVVGDRHKLGDYKKEMRRPFHNFGNRLVVNTINRLYKTKLNDVLSGYRVMNKLYVKNLPILSKGFELETEMSVFAQDKGYRTLEVPYRFQERPDGGDLK
jgi:glycosyltransferase involved in cell wall biosynthesis